MINKLKTCLRWWSERKIHQSDDEKILLSRRATFLAAPALALFGAELAHAAITDSNGNSVNAIGPLQAFSGLNVSGGSGGGTITISSMPSTGATSSTVTFNFTYTGSAPTGLTALWQTGSVTGTISGFSATGGSGSATVTTPASAATYTLHITGTGPNTATATAPNTTVISASPTLTLTSIPAVGLTSGTVPITFTYTGAAPSGLTALWQTGSVSGTVSGFTATGGSGSATISTPASSASYTLHITGTGSNTASATAANTTVVSPTSTITITSIASSGSASSTLPFNFTFTGTIPSGLTALWQTGSISGTITGFSVAGSTGSATVSTPSSAATYTLHITGTGANTATTTAPNTTAISSGVSGFPGQAGNQVGYAAAPGFTSLTAFSGSFVSGTSGAHQVYSFKDFNAGSSGTEISGKQFIDFVGCRFQSNSSENYNVNVTGSSNITFSYCSFVPLASFATSPPGGAWPSAGSYPNTPSPLTMTTNVNCLNGNNGYQYACNVPDTGPVTWTSCDFWGFGQNGPGFFSTTAQMTVNNCWIHDPCNQSPTGYHTDGLGYQNASVGPSNVTITNCTIAGLGNTNAIAFQDATSGYNNIIITGNYVTGYGNMIALGLAGGVGFKNSTFANNVVGTDIQWWDGIIYQDYTSTFSGNGNTWSNNTLHVVSGSVNWPGGTPYGQSFTSGESSPAFTNASNGFFVWPNNTIHATDF